ncbi:sterol desaturase family protein [Simiduia aestuariiviva]|uniref:Sterol desaturase/sphingolipid hydroxylase (Fatty acid hydroxylase superfamily) n=1 Tax=Simiduia aestuariiviva TaxID=1510459 RepID=A0A839UJ68_9GAMM|nr:sterol desaturase family protein [Simiduia aestuariiviva]MBB3167902.1 sterol desaturase/sphingolipid hydroxylase (fatty acid hydroxylase superfamily) [Simiduia aestuariiviva]
MNLIDELLRYWIAAPWPIAFTIAFASNTTAYLISAYIIERASHLLIDRKMAAWIDDRAPRANQRRIEIYYGIIACGIFAALSLLTRLVYSTVWPENLIELLLQVVVFIIFYETYSYFVHRLLHTKWLIKIHAVHHRSTRTTPWSAYSVHPIEAAFIGISAPIFMLFVPMSIGVAFVLHFSGMLFTIFIHSNTSLLHVNPATNLTNNLANQHVTHHRVGNRNFGFVNSIWDYLCKTKG